MRKTAPLNLLHTNDQTSTEFRPFWVPQGYSYLEVRSNMALITGIGDGNLSGLSLGNMNLHLLILDLCLLSYLLM